MTLTLENLDLDYGKISKVNLSTLQKKAFKGQVNFDANPGTEAYKLYAYLSKKFNGGVILDIGTRFGNSALCLSHNAKNHVISYNIVEEGASDIEKKNITWKIADFTQDSIDYSKVKLILIDVDPHDGRKEPKMISHIVKSGYKGLILLDDIKKGGSMQSMWNSITHPKKDITNVGHVSGTGILEI